MKDFFYLIVLGVIFATVAIPSGLVWLVATALIAIIAFVNSIFIILYECLLFEMRVLLERVQKRKAGF